MNERDVATLRALLLEDPAPSQSKFEAIIMLLAMNEPEQAMADMEVIKQALANDPNMRIRLTAEDEWHVYMYSQPDAATWTMTRKSMSTAELAEFIRSGEFAQGEYRP